MSFLRPFAALLALAFFGAASAHAEAVRIDSGSALLAVAKHFGWLESAGLEMEWVQAGQPADFFAAQNSEALTARAAGQPLKAIYVLSRATVGDEAQFLLVSEALLARRGHEVRVVLATLERARQWINAKPAAASRLVGIALHGRSFAGSRPGPAQLAALAMLARSRGLDAQLGAALLDDSFYRDALMQAHPQRVAALQR